MLRRFTRSRLQKVVVENKDFEKLIRQYDRPVSFFYCDPPYVDTEDYYSNITFGRGGHERLRDTLLSAQGMYSHTPRSMLICVVNRHQIVRFQEILAEFPNTFAYVSTVNETVGNFKRITS